MMIGRIDELELFAGGRRRGILHTIMALFRVGYTTMITSRRRHHHHHSGLGVFGILCSVSEGSTALWPAGQRLILILLLAQWWHAAVRLLERWRVEMILLCSWSMCIIVVTLRTWSFWQRVCWFLSVRIFLLLLRVTTFDVTSIDLRDVRLWFHLCLLQLGRHWVDKATRAGSQLLLRCSLTSLDLVWLNSCG